MNYKQTILLIIYPLFSVPVVLVGNKTDLHQERTVSTDEGKKLAESWRAAFLETSAKQNEVRRAYYIRYIKLLRYHFFSQSVGDVFHQLLMLIENENGNPPKESSCVVS